MLSLKKLTSNKQVFSREKFSLRLKLPDKTMQLIEPEVCFLLYQIPVLWGRI